MPAPTTSIYLNSSDPAPPTGNQNVMPQSDGATPQQSVTFYPQPATPDLLGVIVPDGVTITVDGSGKLTAVGTGGGGSFTAPVTIESPNATTVGLTVKGSVSAAVPAYVQGVSNTYASGNWINATLPSPTGSGNALLVVLFSQGGTILLNDSQSNTYSNIFTSTNSNLQVFLATNIPGGAVTFNFSGTPNLWIAAAIMEISGLLDTGTVDVTGSAVQELAGWQGSLTVGPLTTTQPNEMLVTVCATDAQCSPSINSGWLTKIAMSESENGGTPTLYVAEQTGAAGQYTATWSNILVQNFAYTVAIGLKPTLTTGQIADLLDFDNGDGVVLSAINAQGQPVLPSSAGTPSNTPSAGALAYNSTASAPVYFDGSAWVTIGAAPALATTSAPGIVQPDGATIDVSDGVISVPTATSSELGLVKPDGTSITIDNGVITATAGSPSLATTSTPGIVKPDGATIDVNGSGEISVPTATTSALGLVKPDGSTITISNGVISAPGGGGGGGGASVSFGSASPQGSTVVQSAAGGGDSLAFTSGVTSGNLMIVAYKSEGTITGVTISDTVGTPYTLVGQISGQANNMNVYAGIAPAGGANTVTIGSAPGTYDRLAIMEVVGATATVDTTATAYNGTTPASLSITTTYTTDFIFAAIAGYHNADVFTFSGAFTLDAQSNGSDANAIGHLVVSAAGTYTLTVTTGGAGSDNQPIILIALQATAQASGAEGDIYFQTSTTPFTGFVYHGTMWNRFS